MQRELRKNGQRFLPIVPSFRKEERTAKGFPMQPTLTALTGKPGRLIAAPALMRSARWKTTLTVPYRATRRIVPVSRVYNSRALVAGSTSWQRNRGWDRSALWRCFFRTSPPKSFDEIRLCMLRGKPVTVCHRGASLEEGRKRTNGVNAVLGA